MTNQIYNMEDASLMCQAVPGVPHTQRLKRYMIRFAESLLVEPGVVGGLSHVYLVYHAGI